MLASAMWDFILRHPWYPQAVAERPPVTPRGLAAFEFALSILDHTGLPMSDRAPIVVSITNTVLAAAQNAAAEARTRSRFQITDEEIASSVGTFLGDIMASGAYPQRPRTWSPAPTVPNPLKAEMRGLGRADPGRRRRPHRGSHLIGGLTPRM